MAGQLLGEVERKILEEYSKSASGIHHRRAHLILLYDDGLLTHLAAEQAGFSRSQARFWKHQFLMDGMAIFPGLPIQSTSIEGSVEIARPPQYSDATEKELLTEDQLATVELPLPKKIDRPGIVPGDSLAEAGRKTWLYLFSEMLQNEEPTRKGEEIDSLHDMRVATRRMRTAVDIFGNAFRPKIINKHLKGLRTIGRALGRVRDMDVLIDKLVGYASTLTDAQLEGLKPLINAWTQERDSGRQALSAYLDSPEYIQFKHEFNRFVQTPGEGILEQAEGSPQANLVCEIVPILIYTRMGTVRAYDSILQNASDTQLHTLRIEFKKLRYTVEYFREVLGRETATIVQELKLMQDHLGDFHDAVVACDLVTAFLQDWEKSQHDRSLLERQNPEPIVTYLAHLHSERHRLLVTLPVAWNLFTRPKFRTNLAKAISVL